MATHIDSMISGFIIGLVVMWFMSQRIKKSVNRIKMSDEEMEEVYH